MFLSIIFAVFLGIAAGTITGLIPGIHINLISSAIVAYGYLFAKIRVLPVACFIISMSVTHSFLDSIPSIFLGAPDSATALGVLPGHRYLLKGKGIMAVKLTIIGSYLSLLLSVLLFPAFIGIIVLAYGYIKDSIGVIVAGLSALMILTDRKKAYALIVFLVAGCLGIVTFSIHSLSNPLFPMLSGIFGVSTLVISLNESSGMPKQAVKSYILLKPGKIAKALASGLLSGFFTAVVPGLGSSGAAALASQATKKLGDYGFMVLIGSINTVNFVLSLATLYTISKARNGSIVVIMQILDKGLTASSLCMFLVAALVSGSAAAALSGPLSRAFAAAVEKVSYKKIAVSIVAFIFMMSFLIDGWLGLFVALVSSSVGILPAMLKTKRTHAMACIILPVMAFFIM